jgi:DNA-binding CsgD family transcriptional regulator
MTALVGVPAGRRYVPNNAGLARPVPASPGLDPAESAALAAALEEIPSAAFVVWADGRIARSNGPGLAAEARAPAFVLSGLIASLHGRGGAFRISPIFAPGVPSHFLAVQTASTLDRAPRVAAAAGSLALTPRQAQVLDLLVLGRSNKAIAKELACAEATVEIHVTAILAKSGCENRCEVVARIWSEPFGPARREHPGAPGPDRLSVV